MKKVSLLTILIVVFGIFLCGCEFTFDESKLIFSSHSVKIYVNNAGQENYQYANVDIYAKHLGDSLRAEVVEGEDLVELPKQELTIENNYCSLVIKAKTETCGYAKIKVSPKDIDFLYDFVDVKLCRVANKISVVDDASLFYVVRGKSLDLSKLITMDNEMADIDSVKFTFVDGVQELSFSQNQKAKIENSTLTISSKLTLNKLQIVARCKYNPMSSVSFEVKILDDIKIANLTLQNNPISLKKNFVTVNVNKTEEQNSKIYGIINLNLGRNIDFNFVQLDPIIYTKTSNDTNEELDFENKIYEPSIVSSYNASRHIATYTFTFDTQKPNQNLDSSVESYYLAFKVFVSNISYTYYTYDEIEILVHVDCDMQFYLPMQNAIITKDYSNTTLQYNEALHQWDCHMGVCVISETSDDVFAVARGTVTNVYHDYFEGYVVEIRHFDGIESKYTSLAEDILVEVGDYVGGGQKIGRAGKTATNDKIDGVHLEIFQNGTKVDPKNYIMFY